MRKVIRRSGTAQDIGGRSKSTKKPLRIPTEAEREKAMQELIDTTEYIGGLPAFEDTEADDEDSSGSASRRAT